jgi:hypothetical protein
VDIRGTSIVPDVTVSTHELDYGDCFLRYPYKKMIELVNHSDLPAKFELQWQDEISQCVAVYEVDYAKGTIEPFSSRVITVSFTTMRLDKVQLPMFFTIVGHEDDPLEVQCIANGIGPRLTLTPPSIKWGDIEVLKDFEKTLKVKNDSLVPAEFQTLVMKRNSRFKVNMPSAHLAPGETANLKLLANLDDTQPFKDELCLIVTEGGEIKVPLLAKGTGTTICCNEYELGSHPDVKLDNQFTSRAARQYFTITNRGPVPQTLSWFNGTALETLQKLKAAAAEAEAGGSKKKDKDAEIQVPETFYVEINGSKEPYVLAAGASATLEVIGFSKKAGAFAERVCCKSKMEKEQRVIIEMNVSATFVDPVCQFSVPRLDFDYKYDANEVLDLREYTQTVVLKNVCLLPLELAIKCSGLPFTVEPTDMDLGPGESQVCRDCLRDSLVSRAAAWHCDLVRGTWCCLCLRSRIGGACAAGLTRAVTCGVGVADAARALRPNVSREQDVGDPDADDYRGVQHGPECGAQERASASGRASEEGDAGAGGRHQLPQHQVRQVGNQVWRRAQRHEQAHQGAVHQRLQDRRHLLVVVCGSRCGGQGAWQAADQQLHNHGHRGALGPAAPDQCRL